MKAAAQAPHRVGAQTHFAADLAVVETVSTGQNHPGPQRLGLGCLGTPTNGLELLTFINAQDNRDGWSAGAHVSMMRISPPDSQLIMNTTSLTGH